MYGLAAIKSTVDEQEDFKASNLEVAWVSNQKFKYLTEEEK